MASPLVLITGFGPFPGGAQNPSREIAAALEREPPRGLEVRSAELPVTFEGAPIGVAHFVERFANASPVLLLGLGVQSVRPGVQNDDSFRFERRARGRFDAARVDNAGRTGASIELGDDLETRVDLEAVAACLRNAGAREVRISDDAGRYVCERTYRELLEQGARLDVPAVFLHLPPIEFVDAATQTRFVRAMLAAWGAHAT